MRRFDRAVESDVLASIAEHDQRNVARTLSRIDEDSWNRVVELLALAPFLDEQLLDDFEVF